MKRAYLATLTITLLTATSAYAITCEKIPDCSELGYTDEVKNCSGDSIKCPFNTSYGKCLSAGAVVGQIAYFAKDPGEGWLLCDGKIYHKNKYPDLYVKIGTMFGGSGSIFAVPNYSTTGVYLKPATYTSATMTKGCLPDIYGELAPFDDALYKQGDFTPTKIGAFTTSKGYNYDADSSGHGEVNSKKEGTKIIFKASNSSGFYSSCSPRPNSYNVATYIYAGKAVATSDTVRSLASSCDKGHYYYTDGTCSSTKNTSKTIKGMVLYVSKGSSSTTVQYIAKGGNSIGTWQEAETDCQALGGSVASPYDVKNAGVSSTYISTSSGGISPVSSSYTYHYMSSISFSCTGNTPDTCSGNNSGSTNPSSKYYYYCYVYEYLY